jgi:hypothetical protein
LTRIHKDAVAMTAAAVAFLIIALVGFTPTYFTPLFAGHYTPPSPWMHSHAISSLAWLLVFLVQPVLILRGQRASHRWFGRIGLLVAIATLVTGLGLQVDLLPLAPGDLVNLGPSTARFISGLGVFAPAVVLAIVYRRRAAWHLRLMALATMSLMAAPFVRIMVLYLHTPPEIAGPVSGLIGLAMAAALPIYDRWAHGKVERISWWVLGSVFLSQLLIVVLLSTRWWTGLMTGQ